MCGEVHLGVDGGLLAVRNCLSAASLEFHLPTPLAMETPLVRVVTVAEGFPGAPDLRSWLNLATVSK